MKDTLSLRRLRGSPPGPGPRLESAGHAPDVRVTHAPKLLRRKQAARTAAAITNNRRVFVLDFLLNMQLDDPTRHAHRSRNDARRLFRRLADVKQHIRR